MPVDRAEFNRLASALSGAKVEAVGRPSALPEGLLTPGQEERFRQFDERISTVIKTVTSGLGFSTAINREFFNPGENRYSPGLVRYNLLLRQETAGELPYKKAATYTGDFVYNTGNILSENPQADIVLELQLDKTSHNYDEELSAVVTDFGSNEENNKVSGAGSADFSVNNLALWQDDLDVSKLPRRTVLTYDYGPFSDVILERVIFAVVLNAVVMKRLDLLKPLT